MTSMPPALGTRSSISLVPATIPPLPTSRLNTPGGAQPVIRPSSPCSRRNWKWASLSFIRNSVHLIVTLGDPKVKSTSPSLREPLVLEGGWKQESCVVGARMRQEHGCGRAQSPFHAQQRHIPPSRCPLFSWWHDVMSTSQPQLVASELRAENGPDGHCYVWQRKKYRVDCWAPGHFPAELAFGRA